LNIELKFGFHLSLDRGYAMLILLHRIIFFSATKIYASWSWFVC